MTDNTQKLKDKFQQNIFRNIFPIFLLLLFTVIPVAVNTVITNSSFLKILHETINSIFESSSSQLVSSPVPEEPSKSIPKKASKQVQITPNEINCPPIVKENTWKPEHINSLIGIILTFISAMFATLVSYITVNRKKE